MRIAVIGAGNMGGAIVRGLVAGCFVRPQEIVCTAKSNETLRRLQQQIPEVGITKDNRMAVRGADVVILAVKPWLIERIADEIKSELDARSQMLVSVAAGVTFEQLEKWLRYEGRESLALFRAIPNTAVEVLCGVTFVAACHATAEQSDVVRRLFECLGYVVEVEESQMAAGTALASCGIAFAIRYIRAAAEGGVELGFYPEQAQKIVEYTVKGAAELLLRSGNHPEKEIDKVTTPGGITIKGLNEMEHAGFTSSVIRGLKACVK